MEQLRKVKFLHILWHPDLKFNPKFVEMINVENQYFKAEEHLFVTPYERVFNVLKKYSNVVMAGKEKENLINKFGEYGDIIFVHAINCNFIQLAFTRKKYAKKVIWRTWGHDIRPQSYYDSSFVKSILAKIFWKKYVSIVRKFIGFGIGAKVDENNIFNTFGKCNIYNLYYSYDPQNDLIRENIKNGILNEITKKSSFNVLIGHSASRIDNHLEILDILKKFADENIQIYLILSYGDSADYKEQVKQYAKSRFGNKVKFITHFLNYKDFCLLLSKMDCAFFNQSYSSALGVLRLLLYFDKMVYFKRDGQFAESLYENKIEFKMCDEILNMNFDEFIQIKPSDELKAFYGSRFTSEDCCIAMYEILKKLNSHVIPKTTYQ